MAFSSIASAASDVGVKVIKSQKNVEIKDTDMLLERAKAGINDDKFRKQQIIISEDAEGKKPFNSKKYKHQTTTQKISSDTYSDNSVIDTYVTNTFVTLANLEDSNQAEDDTSSVVFQCTMVYAIMNSTRERVLEVRGKVVERYAPQCIITKQTLIYKAMGDYCVGGTGTRNVGRDSKSGVTNSPVIGTTYKINADTNNWYFDSGNNLRYTSTFAKSELTLMRRSSTWTAYINILHGIDFPV